MAEAFIIFFVSLSSSFLRLLFDSFSKSLYLFVEFLIHIMNYFPTFTKLPVCFLWYLTNYNYSFEFVIMHFFNVLLFL